MPDPSRRTAGILLPAFSPRRTGDLGIGDTLSLRQWIDWAADHGAGFLQLLPINETGSDDSPYNAISSAALEPLYLAFEPDQIPGLGSADIEVARGELSKALDSRLVDYRAVRRNKMMLLRRAWSRFTELAPADAEFAGFRRDEACWLDDYVLFRWLMDQAGGRESWDLWPEAYATPDAARRFLEAARERNPAAIDGELAFHAWVQWICFRQWRAVRAHADRRGVKLMGDIPIGVSYYSHDVFFHREQFDLDWCGGAPPETMFRHDRFIQQWGQNWGIPLYRWDVMESGGFNWWRQRIGKLTEIFHIFRIDHVLGFYRIYSFPWRPQRNGEFLDLPPDEARRLTGGSLPGWAPRPDDTAEHKEANRADGDKRLKMVVEAAGEGEVVAEDLGWVPDYVRPHLASLDIAGFRIPHWDADHDGRVITGDRFPECSFATYATHDHDTLAAMWEAFRVNASGQVAGLEHEAVEGARRNLRLLSEFAGITPPADPSDWPAFTDEIKWPLIDALLGCRSRYAALMITDLFGMTDRFNKPGTVGGENWRLRVPWTVEKLRSSESLAGECRKFKAAIDEAGR